MPLLIVLVLLLTACDQPKLTPLDPKSPVTYNNQIITIVRNKCIQCHNSGEYNWMRYEQAYKYRERIVVRTSNCGMPPGMCLSEIERDVIRRWVEEGAKQ